MGLFRTALLLGIGYALGRPAVRHELVALAGRLSRSPHRPDVISLGDREWTQLDGALRRPQQPWSEVGLAIRRAGCSGRGPVRSRVRQPHIAGADRVDVAQVWMSWGESRFA